MNNQEASITLSRQTLERLLDNFWTLTTDEAAQVEEALKAMETNDGMQPVSVVPNPPGTFSHPISN